MIELWIRTQDWTTIDWGTAWVIIAVVALTLGAATDILRTRTPRNWWHDLDKRMSVLEASLASIKTEVEGWRE